MDFIAVFIKWFDPKVFHRLARQSLWLKRQGKIDAFDFLLSLVFAQTSALRMTLDAQGRALTDPLSRQAIDQRYTPQAVAFFQAAFQWVLAQALHHRPQATMATVLGQHFSAIYLLDSTAFDVPDSLKDLFPACGGDGSAANVKLLLRYEFIQGQLEPCGLVPGKKSDPGLALRMAERLQPGQLQLQDKGFYDGQAWKKVQAAGAYLVMPWIRSVTVYLACGTEGPDRQLSIADELAATPLDQVAWPQVWLGKESRRIGPVRMVAFRLSPASASRHRASVRENARRQGRLPTHQALELAGWLILITNAPEDKLPSALLAYLYRLRWQVELIFRQCKDTLRLDQSRSDDPYRAQCEIWARLLAAVLVFLWHTHANAFSWLQHHIELSFEKVAHTLQLFGQSLARVFMRGGTALVEELQRVWRCLIKTARKGRQKSRTNPWDRFLSAWANLQPVASDLSNTCPANAITI
jgi:hypothetical protein